MQLDDRRFLITGATGALGSLLARGLVARGAAVGLLGRDVGRLEALADELDAPSATFDACEPSSWRPAVDAVAAALGGLDGCVVAHGVPAFGDADATTDDVARRLMDVNAVSAFALLRAARDHIEEEGALIAISAIVSDFPTAGMAAYSASKAALSAYLEALRRELRRAGITVLDARLPHLDTSFADRALAGEPPKMPPPFPAADAVAAILDAIESGTRELHWDMRERALVGA